MKLNKETLKQIIKEELDAVMREDPDPKSAAGISPENHLKHNPEMTVKDLISYLLTPKILLHPHYGGFDDYDYFMNNMRTFIRDNPEDPRAEKITQALEDPRIKAEREKANAERERKRKARMAARKANKG